MKKLINLAVLSLSTSLAFASQVNLKGEVEVNISPKNLIGPAKTLKFKLPKYELSANAKSYLHDQLSQYPQNSVANASFASELPRKVALGMQLTPVLNQGYHGSCVTFAVTAALNAALGAGDYVSQLCSLELGSYLAIHDKAQASGWNGSFGAWVLQQITDYGIISKNYQKLNGCAGVKEYPLTDEINEGNPMSETEFLAHSIPVSKLISWEALLQDEGSFSVKTNMNDIVYQIKNELAKGNRLTVGMLLDVYVGDAGAVGSNKVENDTWMLTPEIITDAMNGNIYAGHELVVTGYDDDVEVADEQGHVNKGVFTLRNSWSALAGDQGDYYVSYDYLKFLAMEVMAVRLKGKNA
ncbi:C1 family peptidase [Legionella worsleiensis]|uniref:Cysteine protease n=1 Tax=Legionella worsleiensis TaxID=45076 RepID=A0A0W1A9G6_9GAMM|nr:C1 family peptidase [Legionella worsleiensis]KTD77931.1 cysteine protease [Legionella worsleiensis]STY31649.1 cysteine protease, papain C1 family [Legionella worsleiensis]